MIIIRDVVEKIRVYIDEILDCISEMTIEKESFNKIIYKILLIHGCLNEISEWGEEQDRLIKELIDVEIILKKNNIDFENEKEKITHGDVKEYLKISHI